MSSKHEILYTAEAIVTGGRAGHARTSDGRLDLGLDVLREMGGTGGPGTNPEQLFAAGYGACFQSALLRIASGRKLDAAAWRVGTGPLESGGFGLAVALELDAPEIERDEAIDLVRRAHEICPHRATRGNIQVTLGIAGRSLEDQAAWATKEKEIRTSTAEDETTAFVGHPAAERPFAGVVVQMGGVSYREQVKEAAREIAGDG